MRKHLLLFLLLAIAACGSVNAQGAAASGSHDPRFLNQLYFWAPDSLVALEKTPAEMKMKMKALGFGGGGSAYVMDGARSAVRIQAGNDVRFAVKLAGMMDPSSMIRLYQLDPKKKTREATLSSSGGMFNNSASSSNNGIDCNIQKSGADVFILIPAAKLAPGEYGFVNMMQMSSSGTQVSYTFFTFGIDP
ncbi:MAG TPA: hypothetical protein VHE54_03530 [Puia sp.]|nr:hypothetical protein [Puia sp.]